MDDYVFSWIYVDLYVEKMRYAAVKCMTRSYRPTLPVSYVAQLLGFQSSDEKEIETETGVLEECTEWLKAHGACLVNDTSGELMLDAKVFPILEYSLICILWVRS